MSEQFDSLAAAEKVQEAIAIPETRILNSGVTSLSIEKTYAGYDIKVPSQQGLLGTIHVTDKGLSFSAPNRKKSPDYFVGWDQLPAVINIDKVKENLGG